MRYVMARLLREGETVAEAVVAIRRDIEEKYPHAVGGTWEGAMKGRTVVVSVVTSPPERKP